MLLRKTPVDAEIYNDLDGDIVNLFRVLRDEEQSEDLRSLLRLTPFARDEFELAYEPSDCSVEAARRLLVRAAMGHSSAAHNPSHRTSFRQKAWRRGKALPLDWSRIPDALEPITERLRGVVIENRDALKVLMAWDDEHTLHYVDPPYVHSTRHGDASNRAYRHEMDDDAHHELLSLLLGLKGMVILSGYANPIYDETLKTWARIETVATKSSSRGASQAAEVLWLNPAAAERQPEQPVQTLFNAA